jgi:hypothetical protein
MDPLIRLDNLTLISISKGIATQLGLEDVTITKFEPALQKGTGVLLLLMQSYKSLKFY